MPADWGYGGAPMPSPGRAVACYPEAMLGPDGAPLEGGSSLGWVGRPFALTDVCESVPDGRPAAPYVWLGADVEPGTADLGGGFVQTTVEVNGSLLTVGTDDATLAERILASAGGGETCLSETEPSAELVRADADADEPTALTLCAYRQSGPRGQRVADLVYAVRQDEPVVDDYLAGLSTAPERDQCPTIDYTETEWLLVALEDARGRLVRQDVVHLGACPSVDVAATTLSSDLGTVPTTPVVDRLTRTAGLPAVLATLIGPLG